MAVLVFYFDVHEMPLFPLSIASSDVLISREFSEANVGGQLLLAFFFGAILHLHLPRTSRYCVTYGQGWWEMDFLVLWC